MKVGLYTGPHLHSFRERFVINGAMISQAEFIEGAKAVTEAAARLDYHYSTFELATALALWWFARQSVNIAVLEVGMGGRWDAVNAVPNVLAVMTPIEKEHLAMLGGSLQTIAWHKAGIMQPGGYATTVPYTAVVYPIFEMETERLGVTWEIAGDVLDAVDLLDIPSKHRSRLGTPLAQAVCQNLARRGIIPYEPEQMPEVKLPGRLEQIEVAGRKVLIDGGHTLGASFRLMLAIAMLGIKQTDTRLVAGMFGDKSIKDFFSHFDNHGTHIILTQAPSHRALSPDVLNEKANLRDATVEIVPKLADALAQVHTAPESLFVVTGSLRMAAAAREAFGLLSPDDLEEAQMTRAIFEGEDYLKRML